jgi:hypothetical protein
LQEIYFMADSDIVIPLCPLGPRRRDPTAAERQKRYRRKKRRAMVAQRSDAQTVTLPVTESVTDQLPVGAVVDAVAAPAHGIAKRNHGGAIDAMPYGAAVALAASAAWFSVRGMVVLFPGAPVSVVAMSVAMESAKLVTAGWLARRWHATSRIWRVALSTMVLGLATINASGVYAQLVAAHVGDRGAARGVIEVQGATLDARIEVAGQAVTDLDRRLGQIDLAIETAAKRGRTKTALIAFSDQKTVRAALSGERQRAAEGLAELKAQRASVVARGRQADAEAAPIRFVAELLGMGGDDERAIRWLILLMVACCDPLAIALTAATSARR